MKITLPICFLPLIALMAACGSEAPPGPTHSPRLSLKGAFADHFRIGAAINAKTIMGYDTAGRRLLREEFNTITPENELKWNQLHPARDSFVLDTADAFVELGEELNMFTVGHTLVWYLQLSDYVKAVRRPGEMRTVLQEHIDAVAGRYAGRIDAWDVLNEAVNDDGTMRSWPVYDLLGEDYVAEVFKMARAAAPGAELYYNDYNLWMPAKRDGAIRMLKKAMAAGAPIDGIGMQAHYSLTKPRLSQVDSSIQMFYDSLGIKVMITELDVSVLPSPWDYPSGDPRRARVLTPEMNPYAAGLPDSVGLALGHRYADLFRLFLRHDDKIGRVTLWGVDDGTSWLNYVPIRGRRDYPLLFDRDHARKIAYDSVLSLVPVIENRE